MRHKESQGPKEIPELEVEFKEGEAVFKAGDVAWRVPRALLMSLADRGIVAERFKLAKEPDRSLDDIDTVENAARLRRLMRKGLDLDRCARVMGIPEAKMRRFFSHALDKYSDRFIARDVARQAEAEKDYCRQRPQPSPFDVPGPAIKPAGPGRLLDVEYIAREMRTKPLHAIADSLGLDYDDFNLWLEKNRPLLDLFAPRKDQS